MALKIAVIYNEPQPGRYQDMGEFKAELGVVDEVKAVGQALAELNYSTVFVPLRPPLSKVRNLLESLDVKLVFNLFEGFDGCAETEAEVAQMLEELDFNFSGCPSSTLALALNKVKTKDLLQNAGIRTPQYQIVSPADLASFHLEYPCIVKPLAEDASHGINENSVVHNFEELQRQINQMCPLFGGKMLVEEFLEGREFNTTVMGNHKLSVPAVSEIVYTLPDDKPRILTFEAKWEEDSLYFSNTRVKCPADIKVRERNEIGKIAKAAFKLLGCRGYARVDLRQDREGHFYVLEVNPNPDITPGSGAALQASAAGLNYSQFVSKIIEFASEKRALR